MKAADLKVRNPVRPIKRTPTSWKGKGRSFQRD